MTEPRRLPTPALSAPPKPGTPELRQKLHAPGARVASVLDRAARWLPEHEKDLPDAADAT